MRAVNLIPPESRRGGTGGSDIGAYALLGGLALLLVGVALYVLTANQIADGKGQLAAAKRDSATVAGRLASLTPYESFAELEQSRVATVRQLASTRFDWDRTMGDLARVMGPDVWLQSLQGTTSPSVTVDSGGAGAAANFRSSLPNPAVSMTGCATSNKAVIAFVSRLRAMTGVIRVTLADAQKSENAAGTATASTSDASGTGDCGTPNWPQFDLIVFYQELPVAAAPTASTQTASATAAAPAGATSATPASTTSTPASGG